MSRPGTAHARFERNLGKLLDAHYLRVVMLRPKDGEERVFEAASPATDSMGDDRRGIFELTNEGFVKVTIVHAENARARLDIRHGGIEWQTRLPSGEWNRSGPPSDTPTESSGAPNSRRSEQDAKRTRQAPRAPNAAINAIVTANATPSRLGQTDFSAELLRTIGLANADGSISAQNAKKLKQTRHLVELFRPTLQALRSVEARTGSANDSPNRPIRILDLASGNAYLSFVLADALRAAAWEAEIHGIERRPELVKQSNERAKQLGFPSVNFSEGAVIGAKSPFSSPPDLVAALHACDTATDEAIAVGIRLEARSIFVAPCCQAELAAQLRAQKAGPTPGIAHHGLLTREYGSVLTDAIRVEVLDACGYDVDVVEFVDPEHTPKNRLLRATRRADPTPRPGRTLEAVQARCAALGVTPKILELVGVG